MSEPGKDTRYSGPGLAPPKLPPQPEVPGHEVPPDQPPVPKTSWIEIELVDETGRPIAGERVDVTLPNGQIRRGTTGSNGVLRIAAIDPGQCQISFPRLDADAWQRNT